MKKIFLLVGIFALLSTLTLKAQVTIGENQEPDPAAVLDLQSKGNLGLLLPRVALTDTLRTGSANPVANVKGMFVYNTNASADGQVVEGIYYNDGNRWWPANDGVAGPWDISGSTNAARLNSQDIYQTGQVTIGMDTLVKVALLNVNATDKGIMIPRLTLDQRNAIDTTNANSLMIYNTDEDCFNYYSKSIGDWQSLCGGMPKAVFTVGSCDSITVNGAYSEGTALNGSNFLAIKVNVTKAGNYTFNATTTNGYGFSGSGSFLNAPATETIMIPGQGTPKVENQTPGDLVTFSSSGGAVNCTNLTIPVLPATAVFSINCGSAIFKGAYVKNKPLGSGNTVTMNVTVTNVTAGSSWSAWTNTSNGISFSGSGIFSGLGSQTITLTGTGTPTTLSPITLTFSTNTQDGTGANTCTATVTPAIPPMTVLTLATVDNACGYPIFNSGSVITRGMAMSPSNFGTNDNSTVKFGDGVNTWQVLNPTSSILTNVQVTNYLNGTTTGNPPDIFILGFDIDGSFSDNSTNGIAVRKAIVNYLQNGGVLLAFCENIAFNQALMNAVFGTGTTIATPQNGQTPGGRYQLPLMNSDPIINGPFGNLGGLFWGEDASTTCTLTNPPASVTSQITVYTVATGTAAGAGNATMFKHNTLNWFWVGDGGFNSANNGTDTGAYPFVALPPDYIPGVKNGFTGSTSTYGAGPVYNALLTGNILAWALNQAMNHGINQH